MPSFVQYISTWYILANTRIQQKKKKNGLGESIMPHLKCGNLAKLQRSQLNAEPHEPRGKRATMLRSAVGCSSTPVHVRKPQHPGLRENPPKIQRRNEKR